jgi:hypothetical protein
MYLHSFLTSALEGDVWSTSRPDRFTPRSEPHAQFSRRLGGSQSRSGPFGEKKLFFISGGKGPTIPRSGSP